MTEPEPERRREWVPLVLLCASAVLCGLLNVLLIPLYLGSVLVPVAVVVAVAVNVALPTWGFALISATAGAVAPFVCWLVPVLGLAMVPRPEGDVVVLGGGGQQYVFYGVLLLGCVAGFGSIVRATGSTRPAPPARRPTPLSR